jgi:hypothetical protein
MSALPGKNTPGNTTVSKKDRRLRMNRGRQSFSAREGSFRKDSFFPEKEVIT